MTIAKAKLYKTARIAQDSYVGTTIRDVLEECGLKPGDIVLVQFTGKSGFGGFNFLVNNTLCVHELYLTDFVL